MKDFPGILFLVVGNSGSGKDSIISGVIERYPSELVQIQAPKRYITREPSEFEKNICVSLKEFREMEMDGKFSLKWEIYGLHYGISIEIEDFLKKGLPVIINVSRTIVKQARKKFRNVKVIFIEVPIEITLQRISNRNRESKDLLKKRIERARKNQKFPNADLIIDNSGKLDHAIDEMLTYLIKTVEKKKT